jgi:hypothetical protein
MPFRYQLPFRAYLAIGLKSSDNVQISVPTSHPGQEAFNGM